MLILIAYLHRFLFPVVKYGLRLFREQLPHADVHLADLSTESCQQATGVSRQHWGVMLTQPWGCTAKQKGQCEADSMTPSHNRTCRDLNPEEPAVTHVICLSVDANPHLMFQFVSVHLICQVHELVRPDFVVQANPSIPQSPLTRIYADGYNNQGSWVTK